MSHASSEGNQKEEELPSRTWAEPEPGPSRCEPSRQGYCGYCRVLYTNLDQHLSSLRHLDSVRTSSRGSASVSRSNQSRLTLLERFLQDVQEHHPHLYSDARPSHTDLPSVSAPLLPKAELDELCSSGDDSQSLGTREHLPSSDDASCQPANEERGGGFLSQSGGGAGRERLSSQIQEQEVGLRAPPPFTTSPPPQSQAPPPQSQAPPPVHRKAHRKTNRRKPSESSSSTQAPRGPVFQATLDPDTRRGHQGPPESNAQTPSGPRPPGCLVPTEPRTRPSLDPRPPSSRGPQVPVGPQAPPSGLRPFVSWQRERRRVQKEEAFSSHSELVEETIEEVIHRCCYSLTSPHHPQEETDSFHLSLPVSMDTQSEDWDTPVQGVFQKAGTSTDVPVQVVQAEQRDLGRLMDAQVDMEDQVYSNQLDCALLGGGVQQDQGFWNLPTEDVLPVPEHVPKSFRGKTWAQIEQEDEERVERLVQQFRRGRFLCYFDTESLARFGRRSRRNKKKKEDEEEEEEEGVMAALPLVDREEDHSACVRISKRRRSFRLASRCQVVKVSHGTQTLRLVIPAVHQLSPEAPPTSLPAAIEKTPETQTWHSLPPSYSSIVTPVQPRTSLVYLLCSPPTSPEGSAPKRCRRRRRPVDLQRLKVKYKRLPVKFYEPGTNQILRNPPQRLLRPRGSAPSGQPPPPCVRQLFRSLSPDLNMDRRPGEGPKGDGLLSALSGDSRTARRRSRVSQTPPTTTARSRRERGGRPRPPTSQRRSRLQAPPPPPRREGLRRATPSRKLLSSPVHGLQPPRRGRSQRGRGCERGGR
ncbi:DBF4-type zinc finger-containing protein 2 isoform X2 [Fundulus heteroclitus]|uniref:DBF4-type zinc finger-containing protein 2 isoform X2 n=1 Tax=Fundulus heteroclitus TaxID=8078 RepID=UPI00165B377F|nr:DBF4-type zinc finger-containing protein 2 isoform X2 [Fundulus heteroclitus]